MRPHVWDFTPLDDNLTYFLSNATGGTWTLTTNATTDGMAHLLIITNDSATDHSAKTCAITGLDADGNVQLETLALPAGSTTSTSTKYWSRINTVVPSATIGGDTMDLGITDDVVSPTFIPDFKQAPFNVSLGADVSGTINFDVQHTFDSANMAGALAYSSRTWFDHSVIAAKTADTDGNYAAPVMGIRLLINSLTAGATLKLTIIQGGV